MSESVPEKHSVRVLEGIQNWMFNHRALLVRRVAVILLLLYFAAMVHAGSYVRGDLESGFYFTNTGHGLFPFPYSSSFSLPVLVYFDTLLTFIYVVFIGQWIWIAWMSLGIIYIMFPFVLWILTTKRRSNTATTQIQSDRGEKIDVRTWVLGGLSAILSIPTFGISYNLENYGPLPLILVIGLSTVMASNLRGQESRLRLGSVILLVLGLIVIIASGTFIPDPTPAFQLGMFGTGILMVFIALVTIRVRYQE